MNTNDQIKPLERKSNSYCTKKFQTATGEIENSYLCGQGRFTSSDFWNLQRQKREFPKGDAEISKFSI